MPPTGKKQSVSQKIQSQQARKNSLANKTAFEAALASCHHELTEALSEIDALKLSLTESGREMTSSQSCLMTLREKMRTYSVFCWQKFAKRIHIKTCTMSTKIF